MFFEGYGRGELQRLAERERFIAICPATVPFAASPNLLDALVAELAAELPIDRDRVYLLGHSLGAVTAGRLAALKPKSMRGAALIAGFSDVARKSTPATRRLWAAELDPIFSAESLAKQHSDAVAAGRPFELTRVPNEGHTLVVGAVLPEAVSWLLRLPAPAE
jgi:poly(3-hydroxybutyrate) depolymerase